MKKVVFFNICWLCGLCSVVQGVSLLNPSFENTPLGVNWAFSTGSLVVSNGDSRMGGQTAVDGTQVAAVYKYGAGPNNANQNNGYVFQDLSGLVNGDVLTIRWSHAVGLKSAGAGNPALAVYLTELLNDGFGNIGGLGVATLLFQGNLSVAGWEQKSATVTVERVGTGNGDVLGYRLEFRVWRLSLSGESSDYAYVLVDNVSVSSQQQDSPWIRPQTNLLSGFRNMYAPHVIYDDADSFYKMYFFGWAVSDCNPGYAGCDAIFLARSTSPEGPWYVYSGTYGWLDSSTLSNRQKWVPIITASNKYYDQWHNGDPSVVKKDGIYYMAFSSTGFDLDGIPKGQPGDVDGDLLVIMGATSTDGINWTKSSSPILMYTPEIGQQEHQSLYGSYHRPSLMWDGNRWRMWFDYWKPGVGICMGHAVCFGDPMVQSNWQVTHALDSPLLAAWPNPTVVKVGALYYSFADPNGYRHPQYWPDRQIRQAISEDGINWLKGDYLPPDTDTPANHVPQALLVKVQNSYWLYLYYACQIGGDPYDYRYDRIRYMKKLVSLTYSVYDLNTDGQVDNNDLAIFVEDWLLDRRP